MWLHLRGYVGTGTSTLSMSHAHSIGVACEAGTTRIHHGKLNQLQLIMCGENKNGGRAVGEWWVYTHTHTVYVHSQGVRVKDKWQQEDRDRAKTMRERRG